MRDEKIAEGLITWKSCKEDFHSIIIDDHIQLATFLFSPYNNICHA